MMSHQNIVILGASYAGINTAHYILKFVVPSLPSSSNYHVYLVNPGDEFYHRVAAPRAILNDNLLPDSKMFHKIPAAFDQYSSKTFTFIQGKATYVDPDRRNIEISMAKGGEQSLTYHALIIATGRRSLDPLLSDQGTSIEVVHHALEDVRERIKTAKHIVVGGGGPAGVETASELGEYLNGKPGWFGSKAPRVDIHLITGADRLLPILRPALAEQADHMLQGLGVQTTYKTRIGKTEKTSSGKTQVHLSNGRVIETDVYINAVGTVPNTEFLPAHWLDSSKRAAADKTLRIGAAGPRVYAVGDAGAHTRGGLIDLQPSIPVLATNLKQDLLVAQGRKPTHGDRVFEGNTAESQIVTIGQSKGLGAFNGHKLPSVMIWFLKGRDYMAPKVKSQIGHGVFAKEEIWKHPTAVVA